MSHEGQSVVIKNVNGNVFKIPLQKATTAERAVSMSTAAIITIPKQITAKNSTKLTRTHHTISRKCQVNYNEGHLYRFKASAEKLDSVLLAVSEKLKIPKDAILLKYQDDDGDQIVLSGSVFRKCSLIVRTSIQ